MLSPQKKLLYTPKCNEARKNIKIKRESADMGGKVL